MDKPGTEDFPPLTTEFQIIEENNRRAFLHPHFAKSLQEITHPSFWDSYAPLHKRGQSLKIDLPDHLSAILKIYRRGGLLGRFINVMTLNKNRAFRELAFYEYLHLSQFPTPRPYGALTIRKNGLFYHHLLVTECWKDALDLPTFFRDHPHTFKTHKRKILEGVGELVRNLHDLGVYHSDLNLKNILIFPQNLDQGVKLAIIDFDLARYYSNLSKRQRWKNLIRLYRSALKLSLQGKFCPLNRAELWRFFQAYWQGDLEPKKAIGPFKRGIFWFFLRKIFW